jgi:hypothetical protein
MATHCPKCGATFPTNEQCRDRFELCLSKDFVHSASYGAVHHLIVACYMLQHNEYSREGWLDARAFVAQAIQHSVSPMVLRRQSRQRLDSGQRQWKITRGAKISEVDRTVWTRTIADVRLDTSETYCADANGWASSVLSDTEPILRELEKKP